MSGPPPWGPCASTWASGLSFMSVRLVLSPKWEGSSSPQHREKRGRASLCPATEAPLAGALAEGHFSSLVTRSLRCVGLAIAQICLQPPRLPPSHPRWLLFSPACRPAHFHGPHHVPGPKNRVPSVTWKLSPEGASVLSLPLCTTRVALALSPPGLPPGYP